MKNENPRIRVPKTSELIANDIRAQIVRGELHEGDSLPPESALMTTFGVSRPTLREAFRILESENLISIVRGSRSGATVHKPSIELVSRYAGYVLEMQGTTIADLYAARLAIEPTVVRWLSTAKGQTEGMVHVRTALAELDSMLTSGQHDEFTDKLSHFHQALVEASGNKTLAFLSRMLLNLTRYHQNEYQRRHPRSDEERIKSTRAGYRSFEKLLDLIEAGDVEAATAHWRLHLRNASDTWTKYGEGERVVDSLHPWSRTLSAASFSCA